ncbi:MAG: hypothetical protein HKN19_06100 [Halioglobus sp.]|nr:hypothetical protein [Halioglobus sp.]
MRWRTMHLVLGALGLLLFVLTGQYMQHVANVPELADTARLQYRSLHLYLLGACAANVFVGFYMSPAAVLGKLRGLASVALILSQLMLAVSFFTEAPAGAMDRPIASFGLYFLFGAAAILVVAEVWNRFRAG